MSKPNQMTSWTVEPTTVIQIDGKPVVVSSLPEDIKFAFKTYDRIRQEYLDNLFEQEKLHLAVTGKLNSIMKQIKVLYDNQVQSQPVGEDK